MPDDAVMTEAALLLGIEVMQNTALLLEPTVMQNTAGAIG
jgi:hypothetical protein